MKAWAEAWITPQEAHTERERASERIMVYARSGFCDVRSMEYGELSGFVAGVNCYDKPCRPE